MNDIIRTLRAALALLALSFVALAAQAHLVRFSPVVPYGISPSTFNTTTRIRVEYYSNAGVLLHTGYCGTGGCSAPFNGAAKVVAALEYNPSREEVLLERCAGVLSTVPQGYCVDGALDVTLRVRTGMLVIKHVAEGGRPLLELTTTAGPKFTFLEDSTRSWPAPSGTSLVGSAYAFPAGSYTVTSPDLPGHCRPVVTNNGQRLDLSAGSTATVEIRYRGTECSVTVRTDREVPGLTVSSDTGVMTCGGRPGEPTVCEGRLRFNQPTRITASLPAGLQPYFGYVNNRCEYLPLDRTSCTFTPTLDTSVHLSVQPAGATPPPADPVGLAVEPASASPHDGGVAKGARAVPMLHLRATPLNGTASLQAITVKTSGTGRDDLDLINVRLVLDANGNGIADAGEAVLAEGRPTGDDGSLRMVLPSPLALAAAADLVVAVDVADEVHSAAAAVLGGTGTILAFGLMAWPGSRRRIGAGLVAVAIAVVLVSACGGGDPEPVVVDPDASIDAPVPPPPVVLTYRLDVTGVEAFDAAAPATALAIDPLPITGATIAVVQ